jgi:hypothetical protein
VFTGQAKQFRCRFQRIVSHGDMWCRKQAGNAPNSIPIAALRKTPRVLCRNPLVHAYTRRPTESRQSFIAGSNRAAEELLRFGTKEVTAPFSQFFAKAALLFGKDCPQPSDYFGLSFASSDPVQGLACEHNIVVFAKRFLEPVHFWKKGISAISQEIRLKNVQLEEQALRGFTPGVIFLRISFAQCRAHFSPRRFVTSLEGGVEIASSSREDPNRGDCFRDAIDIPRRFLDGWRSRRA